MNILSDFTLFVLIFLGMSIILVFLGVKSVPQAQQWTVERFGKYTRTLDPGLHLIVPAVDIISEKLSMMETVMDIPAQNVITKDNAIVRVDGVVFYQIVNAAQAAYQVDDLMVAIENLAISNIRSVIGAMILDEVFSRRNNINAQLLHTIDNATHPWGIKVLRVELKDLTPSQELVDAMARQMKAERDKRATILEAEGYREAEILQAEAEKRSTILSAEARREAAYRDAESRERFAHAEAKATTDISEAIADGNIHGVNYLMAIKYMGAVNNLATSANTNLLLIPGDSVGVIGAISSIKEVLNIASMKK